MGKALCCPFSGRFGFRTDFRSLAKQAKGTKVTGDIRKASVYVSLRAVVCLFWQTPTILVDNFDILPKRNRWDKANEARGFADSGESMHKWMENARGTSCASV